MIILARIFWLFDHDSILIIWIIWWLFDNYSGSDQVFWIFGYYLFSIIRDYLMLLIYCDYLMIMWWFFVLFCDFSMVFVVNYSLFFVCTPAQLVWQASFSKALALTCGPSCHNLGDGSRWQWACPRGHIAACELQQELHIVCNYWPLFPAGIDLPSALPRTISSVVLS